MLHIKHASENMIHDTKYAKIKLLWDFEKGCFIFQVQQQQEYSHI